MGRAGAPRQSPAGGLLPGEKLDGLSRAILGHLVCGHLSECDRAWAPLPTSPLMSGSLKCSVPPSSAIRFGPGPPVSTSSHPPFPPSLPRLLPSHLGLPLSPPPCRCVLPAPPCPAHNPRSVGGGLSPHQPRGHHEGPSPGRESQGPWDPLGGFWGRSRQRRRDPLPLFDMRNDPNPLGIPL